MKIMYHVGPWCVQQYKTIVKGIDENAQTLQISGFKKLDKSNLSNRYYELLKENKSKHFTLTELDNDIIKRCRLLRSLEEKEALLHLYSMRQSVKETFDSFNPELVVSETIDQYLMDLIFHECNERNIPFVGLLVTFINGYYRISAKGENTYCRESTKDEINQVIQMLTNKDYKPRFVINSSKNIYKSLLKKHIRNLIKIPYFSIKRLISSEKYNYHYWATQKSSIDSFQLFPKIDIGDKDFLNKIQQSNKKKIFIPLQFFPEATIDYWCEELDVIEYEIKLIEYLKKLSKDFLVVVKEHPNVTGLRKNSFYKKLLEVENLILCPTNENSNFLINISDAVLVWTGSVGFEAALRGKPVLTVTKPYYMYGKQFMHININTDANEILDFIKERTNVITKEEQEKLVAYVLNSFIPGKYINDASWKLSNEKDVIDSLNIGRDIRNIYVQQK
ncbi:hypothetical protein CP985_13180 [Malaciobacter mytili LMG 24559]|uniref:Capsule polysaccharide biosynthesis protein n=1 Tax=Malaciobacter mytili LMG 24559 TaxID=1032238 RepID=A0AAX2ACA5_9BACT|nr:hypothetical protein [Malaciobacter mytili]AXH14494.1 polysaccharide biosynthesis protein [Malaciobacter mytili LMG 24559]RXK13705.1 hypothetical protein CP985_13180 [Malaciobacter mytili LMG 24559]